MDKNLAPRQNIPASRDSRGSDGRGMTPTKEIIAAQLEDKEFTNSTAAMSCNGMMSIFPTNFMLQSSHDQDQDDDDHRQASNISLNPILPPHEFHNVNSYNMGKRSSSSMSFSGIDQDDLSDEDGSQAGEKKRRLNMEQVKTLEKNFELGNKLEPERKIQLARALGLQPRQIAIWFQNRRARWKTKKLEKDYDLLKRQFDSIKADNDALQAQNLKLHAEIMALKNREPTESINLNKETEGSCSNRSENSSDHHHNTIQLDISRAPPNIDHRSNDLSTNDNNISLFPTSLSSLPVMSSRHNNGFASLSLTHQLFHNPPRPEQHFQAHKILDDQHHQNVKEESFTNMFTGIEDQPGFWPWLEQQHQFN